VKLWQVGGLLLFFTLGTAFADDLKLPALTGPVVDEAELFDESQKAQLTKLLEQINSSGKVQLALVVAGSLQGRDIESYSIALAEAWKLGKTKVDNGLLFVVAPNERRMRFEIGYGLEGDLTDLQSKRIQTKVITPYFRSNDYFGGIEAGLLAVANELKLADGLPPQHRRSTRRGLSPMATLVLLFFIISFFRIISALSGSSGASYRRRGWGSGQSAAAGFILGNILGGGGGRGGFGGGGGFSGGGGGFGGGGSSSSW
jgi:uncharacterized protein